jgi:hypothetical protein
MLRPLRFAWIVPLVLPLLFALQTAGCSNSKTVVFVRVNGTVAGIYQLHVKVKAGVLNTEIFVPGTPRDPIVLPTDFTIEMDRSRTGVLNLIIEARDLSNTVIATGSASLPALVVGERNDIAVTLGVGTPPPVDGGDVDAGVDAGDDAGEPVDGGADVQADGGVDGSADDGGNAGADAGVDPNIGADTEGLLDAEGPDAGDDL